MGEAYRGLTIRFAADGTKVMSTLKAMRRAGADVESELRLVNRALKFDGANSKTASRQLQLMAERAAAAGGEANRLRKELRILGNQEIGGKKMHKLSKETKDASTQASIMRERYNAATKSLAKLQNEAEELWASSKMLGHLENPFKDWNDLPTEKIQELITRLRMAGDIGTKTWMRMTGAVEKLRAEFNLTDGELKKLNRVAEFQSAEDKLRQLEAAAKRYRNTLRDAALQARETGHEFNLTRASESLDRTSAAAKRLKEAMRLDPKSFETAIGHARMLKAEMDAVEGSSDALRAEIKQLEAMPGVKELANDAKRLQEEFIASGRRVDTLAEKLGKASANADRLEEHAGELRNKLAAAGNTAGEKLQNQVKNTEEAAKAARLEANRLQEEFDQAATAAERVNAALRVTDNRTQIAANNAKKQAMSQNQAKKGLLSTSAMTSLGMSMYATVYPAAMMGGSYAIQAAQEVDAAYRDMRKTVNGTEQDFEHLKQAALDFGDTHVTSADMVLEFEAMGGQLGIAVENLEAFGTTVANLDIATNMDSDEIALDLGKMASIMHINADEYDRFADALVRLGNNEPALESDIMAITARFASMATIVGMTPDEILAIATAATATGQKAEAAGGALQRLIGGIETKVSGVSEAMKELDWEGEDLEEFKELSGNLEEFANVAGMSADEFAQAWEHDAAGAFQKFVEGLRKYGEEGGSVQALLYDKLGYHNIRDLQLWQGLTNTTEVMSDSMRMAKNAWEGVSDEFGTAGDAANEARKKAEGFSGQLQILKNNGQHLADMLGESLTPALKWLTEQVSGGVDIFEQMGDSSKQFALAIAGIGIAAGPALTMLASMRAASKSLTEGFRAYTSAEATMQRMDKSLIMTQSGLGERYKKNAVLLERNAAQMTKMDRLKIAGQNKMIAAGSTALGALKSVGAMAGVTIGLVAVEQLVAAWIEAQEKAEEYRKATDGIREAAAKMKDVNEQIAKGIKDAYGQAGMSLDDYKSKYEDFIERSAQAADDATSRIDDAANNSAMASFWQKRIFEITKDFGGTGSELAELNSALSEYNSLTGSNIKVVDDMSGRLSWNTEQIKTNTQAYKDSVLARAYADVAASEAKMEAEATVQEQMTQKKLEQARKERDAEAEAIRQAASRGETRTDVVYNQKNNEVAELEREVAGLRESKDAHHELAQTAFELSESQSEVAKKSAEAAAAEKQAAQSASSYQKALSSSGEGENAFMQLAEGAGYAEQNIDEFAEALSIAGINTDVLASVGSEAFGRLSAAAGGDLQAINDSINMLNGIGLNPKDVTITESGALEVKGHIIDLQNMTIDGKSFTVTADGLQGADDDTNDLLADVGMLGKQVAKPSAYLQDHASGSLASVVRALADANGRSATMDLYVNTHRTTYTKEVKQQAAGGINMRAIRQIPRFAGGAVMNGIATRAMLTNQGIIGEAGAEAVLSMGRRSAVVPLTNRRYVRPFARAVASEMPGASTTSTVNNYYSLNGLTVAAGSEESRALEVLAGTMRRGRRGNGS